jgi:DNA-binding NarL/FixJ family response regulator
MLFITESLFRKKSMITVAIVEDNKFMREGWNTFIGFEKDMSVIGVYDSCEAAFDDKAIFNAQVIIMDIGLPGMSGIEGIGQVKAKNPTASIIIATVFDDDVHIFNALKAGASGYLMKKSTPEELIKAIRDVIAGGSPLTPNVAKRVLETMFKPQLTAVEHQLTDRETEILKELSTGKSYSAVGRKLFLSEDGVRFHVRNIYRKLQVNSKAEAVSKGLSSGIIE